MLLTGVARGAMLTRTAVGCQARSLGRNIEALGQIAAKMTCSKGLVRSARYLHGSCVSYKAEDRRNMLASMPVKDEGTEGENLSTLGTVIGSSGGIFPDEGTPDLLFDGVRFADLPIIHANVSKNNTKLILTGAQGEVMLTRSCGIEGFKNARKGTNIAAQATAISLATRTLNRGLKNVRVKVNGFGPGRISAVKGLTMGGLNVVSITDSTPICFNLPQRPRKAKKL